MAWDCGHAFTWEIAEAFKIENGKITTVEAVLNNVPYVATRPQSSSRRANTLSGAWASRARPLNAP